MNTIKALLPLAVMMMTFSAMSQTCRTAIEIPPSTPASQFSDHRNGTVTDNATGLMWAKCPLGLGGKNCAFGKAKKFTWEEALTKADNINLAGYSDWRLPNFKELRSIVEEQCHSPEINLAVFPNTPPSAFWSSSPRHQYPMKSWIVDFASINSFRNGSRNLGRYVRLVRFRR